MPLPGVTLTCTREEGKWVRCQGTLNVPKPASFTTGDISFSGAIDTTDYGTVEVNAQARSFDHLILADAIGWTTCTSDDYPAENAMAYIPDSAPVMNAIFVNDANGFYRITGSLTYGYHKPSCKIKLTAPNVPNLHLTTHEGVVDAAGAIDFLVASDNKTGETVSAVAISPFNLTSNSVNTTI
jgi:hypothetical protein